MNQLYRSIGITKQAFHKKMDRLLDQRSEMEQLLVLVYKIREDHPQMGLRDMYYKLQPQTIGRDVFERFCKEEGLMVEPAKNWRRTTDSSGVKRFDNLVKGIDVNRVNQVWQSDITYFEVRNQFYYLTFIIDIFSRRVVGHHTSQRLTTEQTTIPALRMALKTRAKEKQSINGLILHSDGGGQYYSKAFLELTKKAGLINSMCYYPWDNGYAERLNGTIKNNYLKHKNIKTYQGLVKEVDQTVYLYNYDKPHIKLKRKTPIQFENDYFSNGQQSDDEKSATELNVLNPVGISALRAEDNNPSDSNIAQELIYPKIEN